MAADILASLEPRVYTGSVGSKTGAMAPTTVHVLKLSYAARSGAGAYEQERFETARQRWRSRVTPRLRLAALFLLAPAIACEVLWHSSAGHFFGGFWVGAAAGMYLWLRDEVPAHIRHHADGAEGERATAKALRRLLQEGWHVAHDIDTGRGNRDHVLVGPAGAFLLDSKKLGGEITIEGDTVVVRRVDDPRDSYRLDRLAGWMRGEAAQLHREIQDKTNIRTWVTPIVVLWS